MQNKDFDRFIQQALENQPEPEYNPADWDKLEDRLHNLHGSQPSAADAVVKGGASLGKLGFAATAILVTALNVVFFTQPELVKTASEKLATVQNAIVSEPKTNLPATPATVADNTTVAAPEAGTVQDLTPGQNNQAATGLPELPAVIPAGDVAAPAQLKPAGPATAAATRKTYRNTSKPASGVTWAPTAAGRPGIANGAGLSGGKAGATIVTPCDVAKPTLYALLGADTLKGAKISIASCQTLTAKFVARETADNQVVITSNVAKVLPGARLVANAANGLLELQWQPKAEMARNQAYTFSVSVADSRCPDASARTYNYAVQVTPAFAATIAGNTKLENGESSVLEVNGAPAGATYTWLVGKEVVAVKTNNQLEVLPHQTTTYRLQVTNAAGCTYTDSVKVEVSRRDLSQNQPAIPNIFTPNGDGINDYFRVVLPTEEAFDLVIFDRYGKQVYNRRNYNNSWNAAGQENGTYYYVITTQETKTTFKGWVEVTR